MCDPQEQIIHIQEEEQREHSETGLQGAEKHQGCEDEPGLRRKQLVNWSTTPLPTP